MFILKQEVLRYVLSLGSKIVELNNLCILGLLNEQKDLEQILFDPLFPVKLILLKVVDTVSQAGLDGLFDAIFQSPEHFLNFRVSDYS